MLTIGDKVKLACNDGCHAMNGVDGDIIGYDNKTEFYIVLWYTGRLDAVYANQIVLVDDFDVHDKVRNKFDETQTGEIIQLDEYEIGKTSIANSRMVCVKWDNNYTDWVFADSLVRYQCNSI